MPLRSGGLITGLDTNALVASLIGIEKIPITKLQKKKSGFKSQISLVAKIKSALKALQDKAKELDTAKEFNTNKATSTADKKFTATATGNAAPASYAIEIQNVAKAEKNRSDGFASDAVVTAGTLSLTVKGGTTQEVTIIEGDTLRDVAARINDSVNDVSASVIFDGTNTYLSITLDDSGHTIGANASDALVITETYTGGTGSQMNLVETQQAENAKLTIDGLAIESMSNAVQDALTGITITILGTTEQAESLSIAADHEKIKEKIKSSSTSTTWRSRSLSKRRR